MTNKERLLQTYKSTVKPGLHSFPAFIQPFFSKYDFHPVDFESWDTRFQQSLRQNAVSCIRNMKSITEEEMNFIAYQLVKNQKSETYYQRRFSTGIDYIFFAYEQKTGYLYSNSTKLFLELNCARGVSEYDYEHDTVQLIEYLSCIDQLKNNDY